ncbi:hypothetical protein VTO42DRAFT_122 [Malbranchea cinnamomea]
MTTAQEMSIPLPENFGLLSQACRFHLYLPEWLFKPRTNIERERNHQGTRENKGSVLKTKSEYLTIQARTETSG